MNPTVAEPGSLFSAGVGAGTTANPTVKPAVGQPGNLFGSAPSSATPQTVTPQPTQGMPGNLFGSSAVPGANSQIKYIPTNLGGGAYNDVPGEPNALVNTGHTTYGGEPTVSGDERDDIVPVSLGGANSNPKNIQLQPFPQATYKDNVEKYAAQQFKLWQSSGGKQGLALNAARNLVANWDNVDIPGQTAYNKRLGGSENLATNFVSSVGDTIKNAGSALLDWTKNVATDLGNAINTNNKSTYVGKVLNADVGLVGANNATPTSIAANTFLGLPKAALQVAQSIAAGTLGKVGVSIGQDIALRSGTPASSALSDYTPSDPFTKLLLGSQPISGLSTDVGSLEQTIKNSPIAQKYGLDKHALPLAFSLVLGGEALNFTPLPGGEGEGTEAKTFIQTAKDFVEHQQGVSEYTGDLNTRLAQQEGNLAADAEDQKQFIKNLPRVSRSDKAAIAHYAEDKTFPATDAQKAYFTKYVQPLTEENAKLITQIRDSEIPLSPEDHLSRYVMGKGNVFDRLRTNMKNIGLGGRSLSRTDSALNRRTFRTAIDDEGNASVVSVKGGKVTQWVDNKPTVLGNYNRVSDVGFKGSDGKTYKFGEATMRQIEANTSTRYYKDPAITEMQTYNRLKAIHRNIQLVDSMKDSAEFHYDPVAGTGIAVKEGAGIDIPKGWKQTKLPQFRGYYMEPTVAETLDDFFTKMGDDPLRALSSINGFIRDVIVFNPIIHWINLSTFAGEYAGASRMVNPVAYIKGAGYFTRALKNVVGVTEEDKAFMRAGGSSLFARSKGTLSEIMQNSMADEVASNKPLAVNIAKAIGSTPARVISAIRYYSRTATWGFSDILNRMLVYSTMDRNPGMSMTDAINEVNRIFPDNRIPPRLLPGEGGRAVTKLLTNPNISFFTNYHYSQYKAFVTPFIDAVRPSASVGERAKAVDRIGALALMSFVLFPAIDKLAQAVTGNPQAQARRAGVTGVLHNVSEFAEGKEDPWTYIQSVLTPNPVWYNALQILANRNIYTGSPIYTPETASGDILNFVGQQLFGAQVKATPVETLLNAIGITEPVNTKSSLMLANDVYTDYPAENSKVKALYAQGNISQAMSIMTAYNQRLEKDAQAAWLENNPGKTITDVNAFNQWLLSSKRLGNYFLKPPKAKAMATFNATHGKPLVNRFFGQ